MHLRTQNQHTSEPHLRRPSVSHYMNNKIADPGTIETQPKTDAISNDEDNNRINFEPDETINSLFPPKFSDLNKKFRVKHLPSVNPGNSSRAQQQTNNKNLISSSVGLMPFNPRTSRPLIQAERSYINNRSYATEYSHFRPPMPIA